MIPAALALPGTARSFAGAVAAVCLGVLLVAGCGRGGGLVAVSGTVSSGGAAVADAEVTFVPESGTGRAAATKTLATGAFATRVLPGRYRVTVFKPLLGGPDMHRSALPERFMHPPDTQLAADVVARGPVKLRIVLDDPPICEPAADESPGSPHRARPRTGKRPVRPSGLGRRDPRGVHGCSTVSERG